MASYLPRYLEQSIADALADTRVVILNGARQVGKSTIVQALARKRRNVVLRRMDRPSDLEAAKADPETFVAHDGLMIIDEVQRAPGLILPIKARVDDDPRPGQFLLTGSARIAGLKNLPDALVGRSETIELWPFSQAEIARKAPFRRSWIDALFDDSNRFAQYPMGTTTRSEYLERALRGGFPEATKRTAQRRDKFFESYIHDLIDRDVVLLSEIERRDHLLKLVRVLAGRQATLLKLQELASAVGAPASTLERYLNLLEQVFLVKRISVWSNSRTTRAVRMPKLLMVDSGLAAFLTGATPRVLQRDPPRVGPLLENFVLGEIARQLAWCDTRASLFHYRTRDGQEVDGVLESDDGRIIAIEVKASNTVVADDFRHLKHFKDRVGDAFHRGIVLYTGDRLLPFGPGLYAVPIDTIWGVR